MKKLNRFASAETLACPKKPDEVKNEDRRRWAKIGLISILALAFAAKNKSCMNKPKKKKKSKKNLSEKITSYIKKEGQIKKHKDYINAIDKFINNIDSRINKLKKGENISYTLIALSFDLHDATQPYTWLENFIKNSIQDYYSIAKTKPKKWLLWLPTLKTELNIVKKMIKKQKQAKKDFSERADYLLSLE